MNLALCAASSRGRGDQKCQKAQLQKAPAKDPTRRSALSPSLAIQAFIGRAELTLMFGPSTAPTAQDAVAAGSGLNEWFGSGLNERVGLLAE
jgi:hypothetical protein